MTMQQEEQLRRNQERALRTRYRIDAESMRIVDERQEAKDRQQFDALQRWCIRIVLSVLAISLVYGIWG